MLKHVRLAVRSASTFRIAVVRAPLAFTAGVPSPANPFLLDQYSTAGQAIISGAKGPKWNHSYKLTIEARARMLSTMNAIKPETDFQRRKREARNKLPFLLEFGNQDDMVAFAKELNPAITQEQTSRVVKLFLAAQRERAQNRQPR